MLKNNNCGICLDEFKNPVQDSNDSYPLRVQEEFTNVFGGKIINDLACHRCNENFVIPFRLGEPKNPKEIAIYVMKCEKLIDDEISKLNEEQKKASKLSFELQMKINQLRSLREGY